mmetsp:Transcript_14282/g.20878  ORF Transcript_14282/g.20878 Transcript_14282/m.20878 type:complete len:464 (-) Transcript_14282:1784-3175(-)
MLRRLARHFAEMCWGCGVELQVADPQAAGYIPQNKFKNLLTQNKLKTQLESELKYHESIKLKDFKHEEVNEVNEIEERVKTAIPVHSINHKSESKALTCMRCFQLSKYKKIPSVKASSLDPKELFESIQPNSVVLKVVDLLDFEGTLRKDVFDLIQQKNCKCILVPNKIDALPPGYKYERIHKWVKEVTRDRKDLKVCVVSSKNGEGISKVINVLKKYKSELPGAKFYVVGATNTGKSSFLNKLSKACGKHSWESGRTELTTSELPNTTLGIVEVKLKSLGMKLLDTPGIPPAEKVQSLLEDPHVLMKLVPQKKASPIILSARVGFSFWIGALARLDFLEGQEKLLSFFTPCTVHKTKTELAESVYQRQAGKLLSPAYSTQQDFGKCLLEVPCEDSKKASYDISIPGIGWVSFTGRGDCSVDVHTPQGLPVYLRPSIMPFEARRERLFNNKGKTLNVHKWNQS